MLFTPTSVNKTSECLTIIFWDNKDSTKRRTKQMSKKQKNANFLPNFWRARKRKKAEIASHINRGIGNGMRSFSGRIPLSGPGHETFLDLQT